MAGDLAPRARREESLLAAHAALDRLPAQYDAAYTLAELTFAYLVEQDPRYLDTLEHATGEDLYPRMRASFLPLKYYFAHSVMSDGVSVFDFGDTGKGAAERNAEKGDASTPVTKSSTASPPGTRTPRRRA